MELTKLSNEGVLQQELIGSINDGTFFSEAYSPKEESLNFLATFTAENGAVLNFEFHCSNSAEARDHIESMAKYFQKDMHFLSITGDKWNVKPDRLKRVFLKRKLDFEFMEFEVIDSSFFSVKMDRPQLQVFG